MAEQLQQLLALRTTSIAVTFYDTPPENISRVKKLRHQVAPKGD